jgi:hypothetical protein
VKIKYENDAIACMSELCTEDCPHIRICEEIKNPFEELKNLKLEYNKLILKLDSFIQNTN